MNWLSVPYTHESNFLHGNWSKPFLRNVLSSFNTSVNGPQRYGITKHVSSFIDDVLSYNASQAAQYGVLTALFLIFIINSIFHKKDSTALKNVIKLHWRAYQIVQGCLFVASYCLFLLIIPLCISTFLAFFVYKMFVKILLKYKYGDKYISMMDSTDTVWAVEENNAKSIINVITKVEPKNKVLISGRDRNILSKLRTIFLLMHPESVCPKIFYERLSYMGYHFWINNNHVNIEDHIKLMEIDEDLEMTEDVLQCFVEKELNSSMPCNNSATWEILVSDRPMKNTMQFPILFRIHHTLGDGVALLALLLNTIGSTDLDQDRPNFKKEVDTSVENWLKTISNMFNLNSLVKIALTCPVHLMKTALLICRMPISLINQAMRPPDNNILHGPELNGNKIIAWVSDENCSESLLEKIKRMKQKMPGVTFSELFLTALSASCHKYFTNNASSMPVPETITAVVPVRMNNCNFSKTKKTSHMPIKLENKFSVAMLGIPIENKHLTKESSVLKRLMAIRKETDKLRLSADFHVNYWLMKAGGCCLPSLILKPMLTSAQATLVVSNLPGPSNVTLYGGYKLNKLAFFVPNRGTTGIGVTIISCNDRINLGIMADSALINTSKDGTFILENIIKELEIMDKLTSKPEILEKLI